MRRKWYMVSSLVLALSISTCTSASISSYLTQQEYSDIMYNNYTEDRGIVVENYPELGYLTYKNSMGQEVTVNYYENEVTVEKQPYYENEDKIGYLDEMFPNFSYDPRDTDIQHIKAGDCIYIRKNAENAVTYISAYNDYFMRYGKVISYDFNSGNTLSIQLQDEKGNIFYYEMEAVTPITKGGKLINPSAIKVGDWARFLVCEKILGEGIIDEEVLEIVIDNDTRVISNLYRGQITSVDTFKRMLNLKNAQTLGKNAWSTYSSLVRIGIDPNSAAAYRLGSRVSFDYINRYLKNADGYVYIAAETYKGSENAVKLNFQGTYQNTLPSSKVIAATNNSVKLLSGENITVNEDSIVVRDNRLVSGGNIMVGDTLQAVVTQDNQLAVGKITSSPISQGTLQVYRGRIKKVNKGESFQVETFSLLQDPLWYYHPTPQTFTIDANTKFYNSTEGLVDNGINSFVAYGSDTSVGDVYTVIAEGDRAYAIVDMPYVTQSTKGEIYAVNEDSIQIKDVYYYDTTKSKWNQYSQKNVGATIKLGVNTMILKNGKVIPSSRLEAGDTVSAMVDANLKTENGTVTGYIILVQN